MLLHSRGKFLSRLRGLPVHKAHEPVPVELKEQGLDGFEDPLLRRTRLPHLLPEPAQREGDEVGQEEPQGTFVVGRDVLAVNLLLVELEEDSEQEALVTPPQVEDVPLGGA